MEVSQADGSHVNLADTRSSPWLPLRFPQQLYLSQLETGLIPCQWRVRKPSAAPSAWGWEGPGSSGIPSEPRGRRPGDRDGGAPPLPPTALAQRTWSKGLVRLLQGAQLSLMSLEAGMHLSAPGPLGRYGSQSSLEPGEPVGVGEPADGGCSPQPPGTCRQVV